jgi:predicted PurR-regulated permease PerM
VVLENDLFQPFVICSAKLPSLVPFAIVGPICRVLDCDFSYRQGERRLTRQASSGRPTAVSTAYRNVEPIRDCPNLPKSILLTQDAAGLRSRCSKSKSAAALHVGATLDRKLARTRSQSAGRARQAQSIGEARPAFAAWFVRGTGFALGVAVIVGLLMLAWAAGGALVLVFVALILAGGLEPFIAWLRGHLPLGRGATILLVYGAFFLGVVGLALIAVPTAIRQFDATLHLLPPFFERIRDWASDVRPSALARAINALVEGAARVTAPPVDSTPTTGQALQLGLSVAEAVVSIVTVLTVVYLWLVEHARIQRYALAFVPFERRAGARDAWNEIETRLGMWVRGQLILMGAMGMATTIAYAVLGVPGALFLGLIAAVTETIPLIGPLLGAIPAIVVAATVSPQLALLVALVYIVLQLLEGNLLVPIVMRNTVGISPFIVILSLLVGGAVGGLLGALLAVPVAATLEVVIQGLQAREIPVAQDPTMASETDDHVTDALDTRTRATLRSG